MKIKSTHEQSAKAVERYYRAVKKYRKAPSPERFHEMVEAHRAVQAINSTAHLSGLNSIERAK